MDCMGKTVKLFALITGCLLVGVLGSFFTSSAIPVWYANLIKPVFSPPNWLFAPVWTLLYILMGVSLYLIWSKKNDKKVKNALRLFGMQLFLNAIWSPVFFGAKNLFLALIIIIFMWIFYFEDNSSLCKNKQKGFIFTLSIFSLGEFCLNS